MRRRRWRARPVAIVVPPGHVFGSDMRPHGPLDPENERMIRREGGAGGDGEAAIAAAFAAEDARRMAQARDRTTHLVSLLNSGRTLDDALALAYLTGQRDGDAALLDCGDLAEPCGFCDRCLSTRDELHEFIDHAIESELE